MANPIVVSVEGGLVQDVSNLPEGVDLEVWDFDECDCPVCCGSYETWRAYVQEHGEEPDPSTCSECEGEWTQSADHFHRRSWRNYDR